MNSVMELAAAALTTLLQLAALYFFARQFQQTDRRGRVALGLIVVLIVLLRAGWFLRAVYPEWLILDYYEAELFGELVVSALLFLSIFHLHRLGAERRQAQAAMSDSRLKLDAIVNSVDAIMWEADARTYQFTFVSRQAERLLGYPLERWIKEPTFWTDHIHPEDRAWAVNFCQQAVAEKQEHEFEYRMTAADGRVLWLRAKVTVVVENIHSTKLRGLMMDITERKRAEAAQAEAERKYRSIFENAVEGIFQTTPEGRFLTANPALARMLGYASPEELIRERTDIARQSYVDPQRREEFKRLLAEQGVINGFEYENYRRDGSKIWMSENTRAVRDSDGRLLYYEGIQEDITNRKRTEQLLAWETIALARVTASMSLRETLDELMSSMEQQMPGTLCSMLLLDPDGVHLRHGGSSSLPKEYCHAVDGIAIGPRAGSCGTAAYLGQPVIVADIGSDPLWADFRDLALSHGLRACWSAPVRNGGKKILGTFAIYHRTTHNPGPAELKLIEHATHIVSIAIERKRAEEALKDSEALYHSLVESLPLSVFRKDLAGRFTFANAQFCATMGKALPDLLGLTDFDIAPTELAEKYRADDQRVMATGTVFEAVEENPRPDGEQRFVQVLKSPVRNAEGQTIGIQGVFRDITGQRELEEQFRQSQKMESIGQLAGGVAHDFNNLLTIIQGYTEMVMGDERLPVEMAGLLGEVHAAGERAAGLTRQLLTFSRKQVRHVEIINLNEVIANAAKLLQRVIGEDITIQLEAGSGLPPVQADAGMMDQILMNLAINARDAMSQGGRLTIRTAVMRVGVASVQHNREAREGRFVCLTVSDTGSGMPPEIQARIFEPFFTTKETGKGTGLGLATVFGIVKQHEGWIEVESALGVGTTFKVFLPATATLAAANTGEAAKPKVRGGTETILLVEDEQALRELAALILRKHGYHVLEAASGVQALGVWQDRAAEIDLLLTDIVMPYGIGGRELAKQLTTEKPRLNVIYVSGYSPNFGDQDFVLREGLNFLQKPYHPNQLAQTVRDFLDRPR